MSKELIDELRHEADHWARCATNCTNGIVKAAYTSRSDRIAAAAARIAELEGVVKACKPLVDTCQEEFVGEVCKDEPDDEPVMTGDQGTKSPITFGMIRKAREAVAALYRRAGEVMDGK